MKSASRHFKKQKARGYILKTEMLVSMNIFLFKMPTLLFLIFYHDTQELPNLYPSSIPAKTFYFLGFMVFKSVGFALGNALGSSHSQNNGPLASDFWGLLFREHPTIGHYLIHKALSYFILFLLFLISHWAEKICSPMLQ
jgi:hypothetical protein